MPYQAADPWLDMEYEDVVACSAKNRGDQAVKERANSLALKIRSRCIDLATWQADYSPEYKKREAQLRVLTGCADTAAHPLLIEEFGSARSPR